jgi:hypothetical protein
MSKVVVYDASSKYIIAKPFLNKKKIYCRLNIYERLKCRKSRDSVRLLLFLDL